MWRKWNEEWKEQVYFQSGLVAVVDKMARYGDWTLLTRRVALFLLTFSGFVR